MSVRLSGVFGGRRRGREDSPPAHAETDAEGGSSSATPAATREDEPGSGSGSASSNEPARPAEEREQR